MLYGNLSDGNLEASWITILNLESRLEASLTALKEDYERPALEGGSAKINKIRTGVIIRHIEDWCADELVHLGIHPSAISRNFKATGFFKTKKQDVSVKCLNRNCEFHKNMPSLAINVRSQFSSIQKNFDTLFERLIAEALNLHLAEPKHVAGYVYLIPLRGYDQKAFKKGIIELTENYQRKKYVESFELVNLRSSQSDKEWKYERDCLLTVDFSSNPPRPIVGRPMESLDEELYSGLDTSRVWRCLDYRDIFSSLVATARTRFEDRCVGII